MDEPYHKDMAATGPVLYFSIFFSISNAVNTAGQ